MTLRPIKSEEDYEAALGEIERLSIWQQKCDWLKLHQPIAFGPSGWGAGTRTPTY